MLDFFHNLSRQLVKGSPAAQEQYDFKIEHLLAQRDKQAGILNLLQSEIDTLAKERDELTVILGIAQKGAADLADELRDTRKERDEIAADCQRQYVELTDEIERLKAALSTPPKPRPRKPKTQI